MKVTVLMPIYNAEKYVCNAIDSLLCQTSKNWKLICVDDGSSDSSAQIVEEYCQKDSRIFLLKQTNAGPAVARARAIEKVDTEYVSILDSDDAYAPDYVELMLKRAAETNADSIVPNVEFYCANMVNLPRLFEKRNLTEMMEIEDGRTAFSMTIPWRLHGWQMIRTSLVKQYYTVETASYSKFNSDEYITRLLYLKSNKTVMCAAIYKYRITPDSITRKPSIKKFDYLLTLDKVLTLCIAEHIDDCVILNVYNDYYLTLIKMWKLANELGVEEKKKGREMVQYAYSMSYKQKLKNKILRNASLKTWLKLKFSLLHFGIIRFLSMYY
ncbi:glycosyltransferase family 2 protein [Bacteroides sp. HF-5092]|uniref:glycosyltransferase family 2 protein n=1 Tax=Bacteroides TaxID=816 RepID=UPI0011781309|nr:MULTISPECIES: glycosyltransferase family 2 protein [Bacteroides]TRX46753.1 glycosyltransferase family 2 protein [Bacteroides sp. HF-5092]